MAGKPRGKPLTGTEGLRFEKGKSGNPGGRPKIEREVVDYCRANSIEAAQALVEVIKSDDARPGERIAAANAILDRAFGKPKQVADVRVKRDIRELSDAELLAIISGGRDAVAEDGAAEFGSVH